MVKSLDKDWDAFEADLMHAVRLIRDRYQSLEDAKIFPGHSVQQVRGWFDEPLPTHGTSSTLLLDDVKSTVLDPATLNIGTRMFSYVVSGGNQVGMIADLITAAINQNVAKWHLAPSMTEIERRVLGWTSDFMGLHHHGGGAMVSGGSAANLTGLTVARNIFLEQENIREKGLFGMKPLVVYASTETHNSIDKSIQFLGIGTAHYRKIPVLKDFTIDVEALQHQIMLDRADGLQPFCIVGNAGTVNTGAIDPLHTLADMAEETGMWLHVDGCYGGLVAGIDGFKDAYTGLDRADSIAVDFHKWLYQPYEVGCTLVKNWDILKRTFHTHADYLDTIQSASDRFDITAHHFDLSRNGKALKVWMSFKAYGSDLIKQMITKDIHLAAYLAQRITESNRFEVMSTGPLGITCFRLKGKPGLSDTQTDSLNSQLVEALERDGRIFLMGTKLHGRQVLRACIINHRMQEKDIDYLLGVVTDVAASLEG